MLAKRKTGNCKGGQEETFGQEVAKSWPNKNEEVTKEWPECMVNWLEGQDPAIGWPAIRQKLARINMTCC